MTKWVSSTRRTAAAAAAAAMVAAVVMGDGCGCDGCDGCEGWPTGVGVGVGLARGSSPGGVKHCVSHCVPLLDGSYCTLMIWPVASELTISRSVLSDVCTNASATGRSWYPAAV